MYNNLVLSANLLSRSFGNTLAVDQLSLQVGRGEVFGLLGHNGAGKTTTVRLLNGVLAPTSGTARVLGLDPTVDGAVLRRRTGVLTETPSLDDRLSARATLSIFADIYNVPKDQVAKRVSDLLEQFGLSERADERVGGYSKGMRQRLAIARTLVHDPEMLFLDEPTAGLDPVATREVHNLILRLSRQEQRTVLLCTHNLVEAQRLCNRVAVIAKGRMLATGTTQELRARYSRSQRLQIEVDPVQVEAALNLLHSLPKVSEARALNDPKTLNHNLNHHDSGPGAITVQGIGYNSTPSIVSALVMAGAAIYRVIPEEASLEDVYFALQEEGNR